MINKQTLIAPCCAGSLLNLHESTLRKGQAGTHGLTQIRRGNGKRQRVSFILEEVLQLKSEWIQLAQNRKQTILRLVS